MPEINKLVSSTNMTGFSFFLSLYKNHLCKLRRAMGPRWIPGAHHVRYLVDWFFDVSIDVTDDVLISVGKITFEPFYRSFHIALAYVKVLHDLLCQFTFLRSMKTPYAYLFFSKELVILRTNSKIACSVEVLIWKPNCFGKRSLFSTK